MLVLSRKVNQKIQINDHITVTILKTRGTSVRIGIEAPRDVRIVRAELPPLADRVVERMPASRALKGTSLAERPEHAVVRERARDECRPSESHGVHGVHGSDRWTVASMRDRTHSDGPRRGQESMSR